MGRKGLFSSAAAGGSLIAASLLLVVAVSAMIGVRGFRSAREAPAQQSVVLKATEADGREAGAAAKPTPVVIGSGAGRAAGKPAGRTRRSARRAPRRPRATSRKRVKAPPARNGLSSPAHKTTPAPAPATPPAAPASTQAPADPPEQKAPANPVNDIVDGLTGGVDGATKKPTESIGDVLLDVRDALP